MTVNVRCCCRNTENLTDGIENTETGITVVMALIRNKLPIYWKAGTPTGGPGGSYLFPNAEEREFSFLPLDIPLSENMSMWASKLSASQSQASCLKPANLETVAVAGVASNNIN